MARRVFFSFDYQDVADFRANVVRSHWLTKKDSEEAGFFDASIWEDAKTSSPDKIKKLIKDSIEGTSVTCVLIGDGTYARRWVRYEIFHTMYSSKKLLGVHINGIKDKNETVKVNGPNPFAYLGYRYSSDGTAVELFETVNAQWVKYADMDGYKLKTAVGKEMYGKFFRLSEAGFCPCYDWVTQDGYNNFSSWVE